MYVLECECMCHGQTQLSIHGHPDTVVQSQAETWEHFCQTWVRTGLHHHLPGSSVTLSESPNLSEPQSPLPWTIKRGDSHSFSS